MHKIRVLLVDDSIVMRQLMSNLLSADPDISVVNTAANGKLALEKLTSCLPDVVILDIEMPELDGLETLKQIKNLYPKLPVIMCSSMTRSSGNATLEALSLGADDYVAKPAGNHTVDESMNKLKNALIPRIKALVFKINSGQSIPNKNNASPISSNERTHSRINIVAIGTSTGGPNALDELIQRIPENFPVPIVIVQHMPPLFTKLLAERLSAKGKIPVKEAVDGDIVHPGCAWLAPGDFHMKIQKNSNDICVRLTQEPAENSCRPAVDVLFNSVATLYGRHTLGVILTGMGHDGLLGCKSIHHAGGTILAQDEMSSVVWGMPGVVVNAGVADIVKPLNQIGNEIVNLVMSTRPCQDFAGRKESI